MKISQVVKRLFVVGLAVSFLTAGFAYAGPIKPLPKGKKAATHTTRPIKKPAKKAPGAKAAKSSHLTTTTVANSQRSHTVVSATPTHLTTTATGPQETSPIARQIRRKAMGMNPTTPLSDVAANTTPAAQPVRIANLPGRPLVYVELPTTEPAASQPVTVRILNDFPGLYAALHSPENEDMIYMPQSFLHTRALFRGMTLESIKDLKNILINGLETNKVNDFSGRIFLSSYLKTAFIYSEPSLFSTADFPVIIRMEKTQSILDEYWISQNNRGAFTTIRNIPAHVLTDVMVFLEVNGKPDWYKATLQNDHVVLHTVACEFTLL